MKLFEFKGKLYGVNPRHVEFVEESGENGNIIVYTGGEHYYEVEGDVESFVRFLNSNEIRYTSPAKRTDII